MAKFRHYSFDLWLTLIRSNPQFKLKRAEYFHAHFNRGKLSLEQVQDIIRNVDVSTDAINMLTGNNTSAVDMYARVLIDLNYPVDNLSAKDIHGLYHYLEQLFFQYPPNIYSEDTLKVLRRLKSEGATLSILSNTGFIRGNTLRRFLEQSELNGLFIFSMFSDELNQSKPNTQFFMNMINYVLAFREFNPVKITEIIHIGDNPIADIHGAEMAGIESLLINSNSNTINDIL